MRARLVMAGLLMGSCVSELVAGPRQVFERHYMSVVAVSYFVETSFMRELREVEGRDVGVVVTPDLVLLNGSVLTVSSTGAEPHHFRVRFAGGEERDASFLGRDEFANVAFLRLEGELPAGVKPLRFEKEASLRVGDPVYALGLLPENLEPMVRLVTGHVIAHVERPKSFFVTDLSVDAALGGPVFTSGGRIVGVLSEMGDAGPSFASYFANAEENLYGLILDPKTIARLVKEPPRKGVAQRSWLGITLQALDRDKAEYWGLGETTGIIVNSVVPGSPAERAGLREGDFLVSLNGEPVAVSQDEHVPIFIEQVGSTPAGDRLRLGVIRDGTRMDTSVVLASAPKSRLEAEKYENPEFEFTSRELVFQDYRSFDLEPDFKGVLVSRVEEGGWAGVGGLRTGDIIQKVDDVAIEDLEGVKKVLETAVSKRKRKLVFFVQRFGRTQFITVQPNWGDDES